MSLMSVIDQHLLHQEAERLVCSNKALGLMVENGLPAWNNLGEGRNNLWIHSDQGQVHVGDVFRGVFPILGSLREHGFKVVLASSPGLQSVFTDWRDTLTILDATRPPEEMVEKLNQFGANSHGRWWEFFYGWKQKLKAEFSAAAGSGPTPEFLNPDAFLARKLRNDYSESGRKRVLGIIWRTSMIGRAEYRNSSLEDFAPLINHNPQGWNCVSLQYGSMTLAKGEIETFNAKSNRILFDQNIDPMKDYAGAAAQMAACDYVVSIDCSQAFQAGAFGVPTGSLLAKERRFNFWSKLGIDSTNADPFFPSTGKLFIQDSQGDWAEPIEQIRQYLIDVVEQSPKWNHPAARNVQSASAARFDWS